MTTTLRSAGNAQAFIALAWCGRWVAIRGRGRRLRRIDAGKVSRAGDGSSRASRVDWQEPGSQGEGGFSRAAAAADGDVSTDSENSHAGPAPWNRCLFADCHDLARPRNGAVLKQIPISLRYHARMVVQSSKRSRGNERMGVCVQDAAYPRRRNSGCLVVGVKSMSTCATDSMPPDRWERTRAGSRTHTQPRCSIMDEQLESDALRWFTSTGDKVEGEND
jgi:hypothetical protein